MNHTLQELIDLCTNEYMKRELWLLKNQLEEIRGDMLIADGMITAVDTSPEGKAFSRAYCSICDILEG